jgi:hypothetical protein
MDETTHLCEQCGNCSSVPECWPDDEANFRFGTGYGNDNVIYCNNYEGPYKEEIEGMEEDGRVEKRFF